MPDLNSFPYRVLTCCVIFFWLVMAGGCSPLENPQRKNLPPYDLHVRLPHQKIAVLAYSANRTDLLELPAESRPAGAIHGAGEGFVAVLSGFGGGSCSGAGCGVVALAILAVGVVGGLVGAVAGAVGTPAKGEVRNMEVMLGAALVDAAHGELAQKLRTEALLHNFDNLHIVTTINPERETAANYPTIRQLGYDSVLELMVTRIEFVGEKGKDPELTLNLEVKASFVELNSPEKPYQRMFRYASRPARFSWWVTPDQTKTRQVFDNGLALLARQIFQGVFVYFETPRK